MSALKPWADLLERFKIPRIISILFVYVIFIAFLVFAGSSIIPPFVSQTIKLVENLPGYINTFFPFVQIDASIVTQHLGPLSENLVRATIGLFSNIVALFTIFVISFYLLLERKHLEVFMSKTMGSEGARKVLKILNKIEQKLGDWVRAQLALMLVIGLFTFIGLVLLGIPYALPLAIFAGLLEIVPTIGPIISAVPAVAIALTYSPLLAVATAALYFIIQQAEGNLVVPLVMKQTVGLPPLVTIIAIMVGAKLSGILGALLAVPVVLFFEAIISEFSKLEAIKKTPMEAHKPDSVSPSNTSG
jgi:predicted PurR-regulated permease PerM